MVRKILIKIEKDLEDKDVLIKSKKMKKYLIL